MSSYNSATPNAGAFNVTLFDPTQEPLTLPLSNRTNATKCPGYTLYEGYCSVEEFEAVINEYIRPGAFIYVLIVLYIIVFIVGLVGNFLVCFAVWRNPHMRTVTNYFIVNLAVADFMVILFCLTPTLLEDVRHTWYFGAILCRILKYLQQISVSVSVLTLSCISIERWYAICYPLSFKSTPTRARTAIILIWMISLSIMVPEVVIMEHTTRYAFMTLLTKCKPTGWSNQSELIFWVLLMVCLYAGPLVLMAVCYSMIARCLWSNAIPGVTSGGSCQQNHDSRPSTVASTAAENQLLSRRKAAKMLIAVVVMFAVCYFPVFLLTILSQARAFGSRPHSSLKAIFLISHWLCYFNSAINPVIYNFMSAKFRKEFGMACSCCARLCSKADPRRRRGDSMYTYKYTNSISQTEQISLSTTAVTKTHN
ncbi:orexin receptor type 2-like isoform X2 [Lineus longissimus]|uniref:orexin receptor type 2-like isoform X2 n=1 Tax=Lineus longissimus TaxID=88925 RepID=UPI002B4D9DE2